MLPALFERAGLPQAFVDTLLDPSKQKRQGGILFLSPPTADVEAMTPSMRAGIYPALANIPENIYYHNPVLVTTDTVEEWFRTSTLRPELVKLIEKMTWTRGGCLAFCDVRALLSHAESHTEALQILKMTTRTRAVMAQLELTEVSDIEQIVAYWTIHGGVQQKSIEPIMRSIIELPGTQLLPLSHILPPLARKLLYTYPDSSTRRQTEMPFCHWTSLNFFNYEPDQLLLNLRMATSALLENFSMVSPPYNYGDLLFFIGEQGNAFHSCIYLAGNLVYTKNGENSLRPWMIMTIEDLKKIYLSGEAGKIQGFRSKAYGVFGQVTPPDSNP